MSNVSSSSEPQTDLYNAQPTTTQKLTREQKIGAASVAAVLLGGTAWTVASDNNQADSTKATVNATDSTTQSVATDSTAVAAPVSVSAQIDSAATTTLKPQTDLPVVGGKLHPTNVPIAHKVTEDMTFEHAFDVAHRETGPGGIFQWHQKVYNTYTKEEWAGLSLKQRQEFLKDVGYEPTPSPSPHIGKNPTPTPDPTHKPVEAIITEGFVGLHRSIGYDFDRDGIVDMLVVQDIDGDTYRIMDTTGDQGLDTAYKFDTLTQEIIMTSQIHDPIVLANNGSWDQLLEAEIMNAFTVEEGGNETEDTTVAETEDQADNATDEATDPEGYDDFPTVPEAEGYVNNAEMDEYND